MTNPKPVVVALPLDHQTDELLATALDLGRRLKCPLVVVHALGKRRLESEPSTTHRIAKAKQTLGLRLQPLWKAGLDVREEVEVGVPAELAINTAPTHQRSVHYHGGRPAGDHPAMARRLHRRGHRPPRSGPRLGRAGGSGPSGGLCSARSTSARHPSSGSHPPSVWLGCSRYLSAS